MHKAIEQLLHEYNLSGLTRWLDIAWPIIQIILVVVAALIVKSIFIRATHLIAMEVQKRGTSIEEQKRINTLLRVSNYSLTVLIWVIAIMFILGALGFSIAPILATAGVAGIAVGFGAQSLVKDYFTGFVMLIENQIRQGDSVEIAGKTGIVEEITLRYIRLRDYEGAVHFVPNSNITVVTNRSREYAYAVCDVGISYEADIEQVKSLIGKIGEELRQDYQFKDRILDNIEIAGVDQLGDFTVLIKIRMKVRAHEQAPVRRELLARIKTSFAEHGIEIPDSRDRSPSKH